MRDGSLPLVLPSGAPLSGAHLYAYDFIMADPPWRLMFRSEKGRSQKSADSHYRTMTLEEIKALPVRHLAAADCLLWLWVTNPMLPQGLEVMAAWDFEYKTHGVWAKRTKRGKWTFNTGYRLRSAHETFLIGTRGRPRSSRSVRSLFEGLAREHSRKPEEAYAHAEAMMPDARRLDLFSRQERPGWTAFGDEVGKFALAEAAE